MKIAIDSWPLASRLRHHGTYVYTRNLIAQFRQMAVTNSDTEFCLFTSPRAANDANEVEVRKGFELTRSDLLAWDRAWRFGAIAIAAAKANANVVFSPTPNVVPLGPTPVVCTIHDAIPLKMRVRSRRMNTLLRCLMWSAARFSRAIITDSECSRNDLLQAYQLPESKVSVVHLGYDAAVFNDISPHHDREQSLRDRLGMDRDYIFHHGVIQPRKNLLRLIQAYRLLLSTNPHLEVDLVLAGRIGWQCDEVVAAAATGTLRGRVILTGALEDEDLAILLKKATLVVIPSLYEGFCLPMVEAMACSAATLVSNSPCLVEISGGALDYFDPLSIEGMAGSMQRYLENSEARTDLARRGKARAAMFSWQRCAIETLDVLKKSCAGRA